MSTERNNLTERSNRTERRNLTALGGACALLAVNGLVLGPMWLVTPGAFSDTVATPAYALSQQVSWLLLTLLIVLITSLRDATSSSTGGARHDLPTWILPVVQLALAAQAATHFTQGFVLPWLHTVAPEVLDLTAGGTLQLTMTVIWVVFLLVGVTFAVLLWRAGASRAGAVLMILGALATPAVGPIGAGILGLGLAVVALRALRQPAVQPALVG